MKLVIIRSCLDCDDRFVLVDGAVKVAFIFPHATLLYCHKCYGVNVRLDIEAPAQYMPVPGPHAGVVNIYQDTEPEYPVVQAFPPSDTWPGLTGEFIEEEDKVK